MTKNYLRLGIGNLSASRPKIWNKSKVVTGVYRGIRVRIYTGCGFQSVLIRPEMVGYRFGVFAKTRSLRKRKMKKHVAKVEQTYVKHVTAIRRRKIINN